MDMKSSWGLIEIRGVGKINKKKCSQFVSRGQKQLDEQKEKDSSKKESRKDKFKEFCQKTEQIKIQRSKDGKYFYQPRKNGKFLARVYISASLAKKLDSNIS